MRYVISVARILIGGASLYFGIRNLLDPDFLYGGILFRLSEYGDAYTFYQRVLARLEFQQTMLAYAVAICQVLLGLSYMTGALVSLASLGAALLTLNLALAVSAGNLLMLAGLLLCAVVFLVMGWAGAGLHWGVDGWLVRRVNERLVLLPLRLHLPDW
jgi:hypothetical protein